MSVPAARHLSPQALTDYTTAGVTAVVPVEGEPAATLTFDVRGQTLRLALAWDGEQPPAIDDYVHISTDVRFQGDRNWATLAVHGTRFFADAYPLLRSVADLVQLEGETFAVAVRRSLDTYHDLLAAGSRMPTADETGLFGELLVLNHLVGTLGPDMALTAWRGGDMTEEHDFGLPEADVEVKTTTSEARRHWIGSLDQLRPSPDRPLWLASLQLTGAGAGAGSAERLPDLIDRVREKLPEPLRSVLDARLRGTRYNPDQPHDSFRLLTLRSRPAFFAVDDRLPCLTRRLLQAGGVLPGVEDVSYVIRLDDQQPSTPPSALVGLQSPESS